MGEFGFNAYSIDNNGFIRLQKDLNYIMNNLDHNNVRRLYTEYCEIKSELGETVIDGPLLKMYDSANTQRLSMGLNKSSSTFDFALYNVLGIQTVGIDSSGNATFTGTINGSVINAGTINGSTINGGYISGSTIYGSYINGSTINGGQITGSTITGAVIKTAESPSRRIELSGNNFVSYSTSNIKQGLEVSADFADLILNYSGAEFFKIYNAIGSVSLSYNSTEFMYSEGNQSVAMGTWYLNSTNSTSLIASQGWVTQQINNAIASHIASYHTTT